MFKSIATIPNMTPSNPISSSKSSVITWIDGSSRSSIIIATSNGNKNCHVFQYARIENSTNIDEEKMRMVRKMVATLPQSINALSLAYYTSSSSLNNISLTIIVSTSDGRLFHSESIMDTNTVDIKMIECKREEYNRGVEIRNDPFYDPFMLGFNNFAVKIDKINRMYTNSLTFQHEKFSGGLMMVVGGSSTLNPPTVVHFEVPHFKQKVTGNSVSLVKLVEITGLENIDSVISSILFLDQSVLEGNDWNGLLNLCNNGIDLEIREEASKLNHKGVVLIGHEDGSVYCALVSEKTANIYNTTPTSGLTNTLQVSTACKIHQMTSPRQPVVSIILIPPSNSNSYKLSASGGSKIVCMGALGGVSILVSEEKVSMFREVSILPTAPYNTKFGVLTHAAPFPFTRQCFESEFKLADIDQSYEREVGMQLPPCSFIATSDDGSSYHISIQYNQNTIVKDSDIKSDEIHSLTGKFTKLPIRKEMSCVTSCWILSPSKQCRFPYTRHIFLAFSTNRNGLCLIIAREDETLNRKGGLVSITSHRQCPQKCAGNSELCKAIEKNKNNNTKQLFQTLHNMLDSAREQTWKKDRITSPEIISLEHQSTRHVAALVTAQLMYCSDDDRFKGGNKLINFSQSESNSDELLVKEIGFIPFTECSNRIFWIRSCHAIQNTTHGSMDNGPSLNELNILSARQIVKGKSQTRLKVFFGGTAHSISCQHTTTSTSKPLQIKLPICDKFPITAFLSTSMQYNTGMQITLNQIQKKSNYSSQKRRRVDYALADDERIMIKRAKVSRQNFFTISFRKSTRVTSLGIILPLTDVLDWDLLDGLALYERDGEAIDIAPHSSASTIQSLLRKMDCQSVDSSLLPSDRENVMIQMYSQPKHSFRKTIDVPFIESKLIGLGHPNIFRDLMFPRECVSVGGPLPGVKAVAAVLFAIDIPDVESAQDIKRGIEFSVATDSQDATDTAIAILHTCFKKKMAHFYSNLGKRSDPISESDVPKIISAYKQALKDARNKRCLQYLKQKAESISKSGISTEAAIQLHKKLRYIEIPIG